jgi:hypothetical protein
VVSVGSSTRLLSKARDSHPYCEDRQDERQMREHATRDKNERAFALGCRAELEAEFRTWLKPG